MTNSELATEVYTFDIQKWMRLSMNALAIYEYATTWDQEVMSIWKRKRSGASLLLFAVRYVMLFAALPGVVSLGKANRKECMGVTIVGYILILLSNALTAAFSALRVYALCGGSVKLSVPVFLLQLSPVAVNMYDFIETEIDVDPLSKCIREIKWGFKTEQAFIYGSRIPLTMGDLLVLIITWTKSFYQLRIQRSLGVHYSLSTLMFRDGTVYFLLLLALNVLEMSPLTATEGGYVVSVLSSTLPLILVNRFILNLRELNDSEARSVDQIRTISTPMFRLSVDIAGNMGESLEHGWEAGMAPRSGSRRCY